MTITFSKVKHTETPRPNRRERTTLQTPAEALSLADRTAIKDMDSREMEAMIAKSIAQIQAAIDGDDSMQLARCAGNACFAYSRLDEDRREAICGELQWNNPPPPLGNGTYLQWMAFLILEVLRYGGYYETGEARA